MEKVSEGCLWYAATTSFFENATAKGECRFERVLSNGFLLGYVGCSTGFIFDEWMLFLNKC